MQLRVNEKSMQNPAVNTVSVRTDCEVWEWITPSYRDVTVKYWGEHCVIETWQWNTGVNTVLSTRDSEILGWPLCYRDVTMKYWGEHCYRNLTVKSRGERCVIETGQWNPGVNTVLSRRDSEIPGWTLWYRDVTVKSWGEHCVIETWLWTPGVNTVLSRRDCEILGWTLRYRDVTVKSLPEWTLRYRDVPL